MLPGTAGHCDNYLPASVDTLGTTEGVVEGCGSGSRPSRYTEWNLSSSPSTFVDIEDTWWEHDTSSGESKKHNFDSSDKYCASVTSKRDSADEECS